MIYVVWRSRSILARRRKLCSFEPAKHLWLLRRRLCRLLSLPPLCHLLIHILHSLRSTEVGGGVEEDGLDAIYQVWFYYAFLFSWLFGKVSRSLLLWFPWLQGWFWSEILWVSAYKSVLCPVHLLKRSPYLTKKTERLPLFCLRFPFYLSFLFCFSFLIPF